MEQTDRVYTVVTFAPVQGFIERSRKLRDLYGSSYLLSFLAQSICLTANSQKLEVISPATPNITQGLPNQILIQGALSAEDAKRDFMNSWRWIVNGCREWIEQQLPNSWEYQHWRREWNLWAEHSWEFFIVQGAPGEGISQVRQRLNEAKRQRAWTAVNWQGESSTLSGGDAVAWPEMGKPHDPRRGNLAVQKGVDGNTPVEQFYTALSQKLGETFAEAIGRSCDAEQIAEYGAAFIDPDEELSIPELVKRLVTHKAVVQYLQKRQDYVAAPPHLPELADTIAKDLDVESFRELNRLPQKRKKASDKAQERYWTGWFMGDGDGASDYLKWVGQQPGQNAAARTQGFSRGMRDWGEQFKYHNGRNALPDGNGRVVYAGGDDFLGVLFRTDQQLEPRVCLQWLTQFKAGTWEGLAPWTEPDEKITASVGFVWASPQVPQRDVLQHARAAEKSAKGSGKDRVAIRVLFAGGNHLEWVCPWWILATGLFETYQDRNQVTNALKTASWTHFYNDVAVLEARHAFGATLEESCEIAIALFQVYFPKHQDLLTESNFWNQKKDYKITKAGILGDRQRYTNDGQVNAAINNWVINLAKVGFYLCSNT
jgi:CRISPR-associated protein Cmr2